MARIGFERAPRLRAGARRTAELVPADARRTVPVLDADGELRAGVRALDVLPENARLSRDTLAGIDDVVLTAGGDEQVMLAGVRSFEPGQREYVERAGIRSYGVGDVERAPDGLAGPVYVHVDLDVLDPAEFASTCYPEPDGVPVRRLIDLVSRVGDVVGASLTEHAPADDAEHAGDADVIRRSGAALRR